VKGLPGGRGAAKVTMSVQKDGLPIHSDAAAQDPPPRVPRGQRSSWNVQPGSPDAPNLKSGGTIPINQTATSVQFGQVLTALQSDTRKNLQNFLKEYSQGLADGGAQGFRQAVKEWPSAYRNGSLANEATLGTQPHDLSTVEAGAGQGFRALDVARELAQEPDHELQHHGAAFAREDQPLQQAIPALDSVLRTGTPALSQLNASLPSLRRFAVDALPGVEVLRPDHRRSMPFVTQARRLVQQSELKGLTEDLMITIPPLAKLNHDTIPLLDESRALSSCQNNVLLPFATTKTRTRTSPSNSDAFYKQAPRALVGLAGESRINDSNSRHVPRGGGRRAVHRAPDRRRWRADLRPVALPARGHAPGQAERSSRGPAERSLRDAAAARPARPHGAGHQRADRPDHEDPDRLREGHWPPTWPSCTRTAC